MGKEDSGSEIVAPGMATKRHAGESAGIQGPQSGVETHLWVYSPGTQEVTTMAPRFIMTRSHPT